MIPATFVSNLFEGGIRLDGSKCDCPDPLKFAKAVDIAQIVFREEQNNKEMIMTSFKAGIYLILEALFPDICRKVFA